jgi:hypothetical protein
MVSSGDGASVGFNGVVNDEGYRVGNCVVGVSDSSAVGNGVRIDEVGIGEGLEVGN